MVVKLDVLCIDFVDNDVDERVFAILNILRAKGGYKRLYIWTSANQTLLTSVISIEEKERIVKSKKVMFFIIRNIFHTVSK